jgi:hypothetical protein
MRPEEQAGRKTPSAGVTPAGSAAGLGVTPADKSAVKVVKLKDGVMVQVPVEDLLDHVEEVLQRKINLLNWLIKQYDSMPDDILKSYLENLRDSLEKLKLNVKARALIMSETAWAWISYLWIISGISVEEVLDRARTISDIKSELEEKGYVEIKRGENP